MVTSLYASLLGVLLFVISLETIKQRRKNQISLGTGENHEIMSIVSAHSNFTSYTPLFIIELFLLENSSMMPSLMIHLFGTAFVLGRALHFLAFKEKMNFKLRVLGMQLTLFPLIILSGALIYTYFRSVI